MQYSAERGFFAKLFDLSFRDFVTPSIISIIYVIILVVLAIYALIVAALGFMPSYGMFGGGGPSFISILWHLVGAVLLFVIGAIVARVQLEFVMAVFRIAENTAPKE